MPACPSCAAPITDDAAFCPRCGAAIGECSSAMTATGVTEDIAPGSAFTPSRPPSQSGSSASGILGGGQGLEGDYAAGTILAGRYRIVGLLGRGGMGQVYRADDLSLGQAVALKFLPDDLVGDESRLERFRSEVRVSRQVSHPNVCRVHDIGEADGKVFLSMELVDGGDLSSLLKRVGRLPADKGLEIARQLCAGLAAAHDRGVLHRDLKPANVMIDSEGRVRIADFGLAGLAGGFEAGEIRSGTPAYMAPEALSGKEVTQRSDIYALGLVLYELFTGSQPFKGNSVAELMKKHQEETPSSPSRVVADLDPEVERVVLQCLEKQPRDRPPTALAVAAMLPGGDPLAAMLAAGETPSPELVAQAGTEGGISPVKAWALFAGTLALLAASALLTPPQHLLHMVPMERPPEVQLDRGRETLGALGLDVPTGDSKHGFFADQAITAEIDRDGVSADERELLSSGEVVPVRFWMRAAASELVSDSPSGIVSPTRPPRRQPGEVYASFDGSGRLLFLEVVPDTRLQLPALPTESSLEMDWAPLFAAAGLDPDDFEATSPLWSPPQYVAGLVAWTRADDQSRLGVARVEAGTRNGHVVYLRTSCRFQESEQEAEATTSGMSMAQTLLVLQVVTVLVGGAMLARRNVRLGRGDARGALRLAAVVFAVDMAQWLVSADHAFGAGSEFGLFVEAAGISLFMAGFVWLLYMALEPEVRRHWPRRLITWQRVLAKRFRDPLVGSHVLAGVFLGAALIALASTTSFTLWSFYESTSSLNTSGIPLVAGTGRALGAVFEHIGQAVFAGVFFTVLVLLARLLLRRTWAAVGLAMVIVVALNALGADPWYLWATVTALVVFGVLFSLLRYGLLSLVVTVFVLNLMQAFPVSLSPSTWFVYASLMPLLVLAALAFAGLSVALGKRQA